MFCYFLFSCLNSKIGLSKSSNIHGKEDKKTEKLSKEKKKTTGKLSKEEKKAKKASEKLDKKAKKNKADNKKEKKPNKFIETIKKRWLINGTKTFLLVVIILAVFVGISVLMKKINPTPIDLTEDKLFTLTSESKEKVKKERKGGRDERNIERIEKRDAGKRYRRVDRADNGFSWVGIRQRLF